MIMETWRDVKGYEGYYQVSDNGSVKSLDRIDCKGQRRKERLLSLCLDSDGYNICVLSKDKVKRTTKVHRLVAQHFIDNPNNKIEVNHIDGIKTNNSIANLEWATPKENQKHSRRIGLHPEIAETHKAATLTNKQVIEIFNSDKSYKELAKEFKASTLIICRIKIGKTWSSITGKKHIKSKVA